MLWRFRRYSTLSHIFITVVHWSRCYHVKLLAVSYVSYVSCLEWWQEYWLLRKYVSHWYLE
jgi:hypothetical protein